MRVPPTTRFFDATLIFAFITKNVIDGQYMASRLLCGEVYNQIFLHYRTKVAKRSESTPAAGPFINPMASTNIWGTVAWLKYDHFLAILVTPPLCEVDVVEKRRK